jgi:dUTPase
MSLQPSFFKNVLQTYDRFMLLRIFIDSDDEKLIQKYKESSTAHNNKVLDAMNMIDNSNTHIDAGFDIFAPCDAYYSKEDSNRRQYKIDHRIICSAVMFTSDGKHFNTGYYLYPRSSISKTNLRLANSVGIIDSGYRGHLIGVFDHHDMVADYNAPSSSRQVISAHDRLLQICAPGLVPVLVELEDNIDSLGTTDRGNKGFGSSGM